MAKKKAEEPRGDASGGAPAGLTGKQAERIRKSIELMAKTVPMKIDELLPYQRNQKDHPEEQIRNLANSLQRFGWRQPVVIDENKAFVKFDGGPRRVSDVKVLNPKSGQYEPLDPARTYSVGGTTYMLRDAGDGYEMLKGAGRDTGGADVEVLEKYITDTLHGDIPASQYGQSANRITIKK